MSNEEAEKTFWTTIITSILFIVFGLYLLFQPDATILMISRCINIITLAVSLFGLFRYLKRKNKEKKVDYNIIYSVIALVLTIILFIKPYIISGIVPLVITIIMVTNILLKLGFIKELKTIQVKDFGTSLLIFILMIILSIFILFNPFESVLNINQSMGMLIVFYSILDVIMCYLFRNNIN